MLAHPWFSINKSKKVQIFTEKEQSEIRKEYFALNLMRMPGEDSRNGEEQSSSLLNQTVDLMFTEHDLERSIDSTH